MRTRETARLRKYCVRGDTVPLNGQFNRQLNEQLQQAMCHATQQPKKTPKPGTQIVTVTMSTTNKYYK